MGSSSPFPGMDPFIERHWLDVHNRLVILSSVMLNERLPADLVASTDERVKVEGPDEAYELFRPDVSVLEPGGARGGEVAVGAAVMPPGTVRIVARVEPAKERFVRVVEAGTDRAITVIEFLSPSNKAGEGLADYRGKREALLAGGVNVVEVDLCRRGDWERLLRPHPCPMDKRTAYRAVTRLAAEREAVYLVPMRLRDPLPALPIPLRSGDPEVTLPLGDLVRRVYETGRFGTRVDYGKPCEPALEGEDAAWAGELLATAGKR